MRCQSLLYFFVVAGLFACASDPHRTDMLMQSAPKASSTAPPAAVVAMPPPPPPAAKAVAPTPVTVLPKPADANASSEPAPRLSGLLRPLIGRSRSVESAEQSSRRRATEFTSEPSLSGTGPAAYYFPHDMTVGESYSVYLRIGLQSGLNELTKQLRTDVAKSLKLSPDQIDITLNNEAPSEAVTAGKVEGISSVETGRIMKANLTASKLDFDVINVMPADGGAIEADKDGVFSWQWNVTPIRSSDKELALMLTASIVSERGIPHSAAGKKSIDIHVMVHAQPAPVLPPKSWLEKLKDNVADFFYQTWQAFKNHLAEGLAVFIGTLVLGWKKIMRRFFRRTLAKP